MNGKKEVLKNKKYENLVEENSRLKMLIKHIFSAEMMECSPECCPLCYEGSSCDGSYPLLIHRNSKEQIVSACIQYL